MKERAILFTAPMVNAIFNGTKTVTRRTNGLDKVNLNPEARTSAHYTGDGYWDFTMHDGPWHGLIKCPYGQVGDQLWVKETWRTWESLDHVKPSDLGNGELIEYAAGGNSVGAYKAHGMSKKWRSPLFMQKRFSRIQLEITGVRVERLNDISEADAIWEGYKGYGVDDVFTTARNWYRSLWETINGAGSWAANPWVWVIEFKRIS